jgi:phosphate transport system substrate-binding protein
MATRSWILACAARAAVAALLGLGVAAAAGAEAEHKALQMEGSTTVGPIADAFAEVFQKLHPDWTITVKKTGSGDGASALVDKRCDIANMSRFMKPEEFKKAVEGGVTPVAHAIAMDGVCIIVHPSNPLTEITIDQARKIYAGEVTNWKELGGPDVKIVAISRETNSGTYETFEHFVMGNVKMAAGVEYVTSNPQAHARVKTTAGAVSYVGLGFVDKDVKALKVNGILPTRKTIATGTYPLSRPLYMFTDGYPRLGSVLHAFVTYYLCEKGQEIIEAKGFIPLTQY